MDQSKYYPARLLANRLVFAHDGEYGYCASQEVESIKLDGNIKIMDYLTGGVPCGNSTSHVVFLPGKDYAHLAHNVRTTL